MIVVACAPIGGAPSAIVDRMHTPLSSSAPATFISGKVVPRYRTHVCSAFTMIELLVAVSVIGVLASLLMSAIGSIRASSEAVACKNNLRQAYLANLGYSNDNKGLICPSSIALPARPTVELPWSYFVAEYAEKSGYGASKNVDIIPTIAICKPFIKKFPALLDWTATSVGNVRAWGYARNPVLGATNADTGSSTTLKANDYSNAYDVAKGIQANAGFRYFRWSEVSSSSTRLFLGEGYYESAGQLHSTICQTGLSLDAMDIKYQYTYQWGTTLNIAGGRTIQIGTTTQSPAGVTTDIHRGKRSSVMCDGSIRHLTDRYDDPKNQLFLSITNPQALN